uniref:Uncharacterized protein n=1 Tax=Shewanella putrefaciens (strain 200) TaxID=399804 RepID=E6XLF4_SHEP2
MPISDVIGIPKLPHKTAHNVYYVKLLVDSIITYQRIGIVMKEITKLNYIDLLPSKMIDD